MPGEPGMPSVPNFFIVGAPKCGTTSLAQYLSEHPSIFMCEPKEPSYFARDLIECRTEAAQRETPWRYEETEYLKLFDAARPSHVAVGEASTTYLYSPSAARAIRAVAPGAKIVVMLRDPVELVQALHAQKLLEGEETEHSFEAAWRLQTQRRMGHGFARPPLRPRMLLYGDVGCLGAQVQRLLTVFPRTQAKVILYDDFAADTVSVYREVLSFLDVPDDGRDDFPVHNQNRRVSNRWIHRLATWKFGAVLTPYRYLRRRFGLNFGASIRRQLFDASSSIGMRAAISPELRGELRAYFDRDIGLLEQLLGRSLAAWREDDVRTADARRATRTDEMIK